MKKPFGMLLGAAAALLIGTGVVAAAPPKTDTGNFDFGTSLVPATGPNGESGRNVFLQGAITGRNFEPGICLPDPDFFGKCATFTKSTPDQPGEFQRAHPGQTAFTSCIQCTVDGRTGNFTLKISYPNPKNLTFTKFTIQDASGGLAGLRGQGTLDFTKGTYTLKYQFTR